MWEIKKKQRIWLLTGMVLVGAFLWAGSVFAAEKVSVDRYLRSKRYDTYYVYNDSSQSIPLYMGRSTASQIYGYLGYGDAVKLQKSLLKRGKKYRFLPVYMPREKGTLYVVAGQVKVKGIRLKQMSTNPLRHKVVRYGIKFLGTPFSLGSSSLTGGIDCAKFCKSMLSVCRDLFRVSPYRQPAVPGNDGSHPEFTGRRSAVLFRKRYVWAYRPCSHVLRRWLYYSCFRALRRDLSFWRNLCETGQLWKPQAGALQADYTGVNEYGRIFTGRRDHQHPRVKR